MKQKKALKRASKRDTYWRNKLQKCEQSVEHDDKSEIEQLRNEVVELNGKSLEEEIIYLQALKLNGYRSIKY